MELVKDVLNESQELTVTEQNYEECFDKLKFEWALRLQITTHMLNYWRQQLKQLVSEDKSFCIAQIESAEESFKVALKRYSELEPLDSMSFFKKEVDAITTMLEEQIILAEAQLVKKREEFAELKTDNEKYSFLDKIFGSNESEESSFELFLDRYQQSINCLKQNFNDWQNFTEEEKYKYVYLKNSHNNVFQFANHILEEFKQDKNGTTTQ